MLNDCKYENDDYGNYNDGYIYDDVNDERIPDHDYHVEDGSIAGTGEGEGKYPAQNGG